MHPPSLSLRFGYPFALQSVRVFSCDCEASKQPPAPRHDTMCTACCVVSGAAQCRCPQLSNGNVEVGLDRHGETVCASQCIMGDLLTPAFELLPFSAYYFTLKMEAMCYSETSTDCQRTTSYSSSLVVEDVDTFGLIATGYGLDDRRGGVRVPVRSSTQPPIHWVPVALSPVKPRSTKRGSIPPVPPCAFIS
jgi:hypothetical protein